MAKLVTLETKKRDVRLKDIPLFYKGLTENKISVGVHKEQGQENLKHALWNEFGTVHITKHPYKFRRLVNGHFKTIRIAQGSDISIPPRPFVRLKIYPKSIFLIEHKLQQRISNAIRGGLHAPKTESMNVLTDVAKFAEDEMKIIALSSEHYESNANLTVELKGFNQPLVETGKMINAIKGKVKKR